MFRNKTMSTLHCELLCSGHFDLMKGFVSRSGLAKGGYLSLDPHLNSWNNNV